MSKKVVRDRDSYVKNWTAAITGSFVLLSAQAAQANEHRAAFRDFRANNPGLERRDLRDAFRQQLNIPTAVPSSAGNVTVPDVSNRQARLEARQERILMNHNAISNVSRQLNDNGLSRNLRTGIDLDLTSQVRNITLGEKLFGNTASIQIQVGGETKTLSAGSQVTAAEYVAAKQVLAGLSQKVTIDGAGSATGGEVDLSSITARGDVMKASSLTVPVNVTTLGDFSKGSEFKLVGDLTNSGTVHALNSSGNGRGGTLRADDILNNASGVISSDVDLNLHADGSLTNYGSIASQGNLTVTSSNVTNRGSMSSANDVNFNTPTGALNVDNTGGTISAANNINVNANADSSLSGGDWLSRNLNLNAGAGTISTNLGGVTGAVNSTGYAVHFNSATETLNLGEINLIDPTFYNIGNINFTGSINVVNNPLTIIATGNITESVIGPFNISTASAGNAGGDLTMIAGANITSASPPGNPTVGAGAPATVTFNQGSIGGGSIRLNDVQITTSGDGGGDSGDVLLAAFAGTNGGTGQVNLGFGSPTVSSNINTGNNSTGLNGNVHVIAPNGINLDSMSGSIDTTGGASLPGTGEVAVISAQPTSAGPVTYASDGSLQSGQLVSSTTVTNGTITLPSVTADGQIFAATGGNIVARDLWTSAANSNVSLYAGVNPFTLATVNVNSAVTLNGAINAFATGSSVFAFTGGNFNQNDGSDITADQNIGLLIGGDINQLGWLNSLNGSVLATGGGDYTLGNTFLDFVSAAQNVSIAVTGDLFQSAFIQAGYTASFDGSVSLSIGGDYSGLTADADITAGQGAPTNVGSVTLSARNVANVAGADIIGNDVYLTADSTGGGGDFDIAGVVSANKVGGGTLAITQNGALTEDITDSDFLGGFSGAQITLANNTANGNIEFFNNLTGVYDFQNVTANAGGDITLVEPVGGGRDGNINFVGSSASGDVFTVLVDGNITSDALGVVGGVSGILTSNNGNIGSNGPINYFNTDFDNLVVNANGGPSPTAGNAYISGVDGVNFEGANSNVTGELSVYTPTGDITTDASASVSVGSYATFETLGGNIGGGLLNPFNINVGSSVGQGVLANASGDAHFFDPTNAAIDNLNNQTSSVGGEFSFVTGAFLNVRQDISAGTDIGLVAPATLTLAPNVGISALADVALVGGTITGDPTSLVTADNLVVDVTSTATVYTNVNSVSTINGNGSLTVFEADGITLAAQSVANLTVNASQSVGGDVFTNADFSVSLLQVFNDNGGNIFIDNQVTGTVGVTLNTSAGGGGISGIGTLISPSIGLFTSTADIDLDVNGVANGSTALTAQASSGGNVTITYLGSGDLSLGGSSGNGDFTVTATDANAAVGIINNIDGTGVLDVTVNELFFDNQAVAAFDSVSVQSLAGSGLLLDGGDTVTGGSFVTSIAGPGVTLTATDGSFIAVNKTNFVGGDVFVTLANNNGINAFDVSAVGANLNGDGLLFPPGNDITITAALITGNSLMNVTNFNNINVIGNTIHNSNGDVVLPGNLNYQGQNLAIIASGNVSAVLGTTTIDLSSGTGNGGNLTILAGFNNAPPTVGTEATGFAVTITGFSAGGNVNLSGVNIITSATGVTGDAGSVTVIANGVGVGTGNVTIGNVTATSVNGFGGLVAVGGTAGVTVGNVSTAGGIAGGDVLLGVGNVTLAGTPTFNNGALTSGGFIPNTLTAGDLSYGAVNAGSGDVAVNGAFTASDTINGGLIQANNLEVNMGAGVVTLSTDVDEVQADATFAPGGTLTVNEGGSINVDHIDGANLDVNINAFNTINLIGDINVGTGDVALASQDITRTVPTAKVSAFSLDVDVVNAADINTSVDFFTTSGAGGGDVTITEDDGLTLGSQASLASLFVSAGQVTAGAVATTSNFSVGSLTIENNGAISINNALTATVDATIDATPGTGLIGGTGSVTSPIINLFANAGGIDLTVNGIAGGGTDLSAQATGGTVDVFYTGTGTLTLESSTGNVDYVVSANAGSVSIEGDIDGTGDLTITSDNVSFANSGSYEVTFDDITVQSLTDLTVSGGTNGGTFNSTNSTNFTATNGDLNTNNLLNFNGGDVFMTLTVNNSINGFFNNGTLNGDGAFDGDPSANSLTIAANLTTLGTITNFSSVNLLGNTIVNTTGNVVLPTNLVFSGQDLAILASGNITATGATLIDLSSNTGDGGNLYIIAGYNFSGIGGGQQRTTTPIVLGSVSTTGGNVVLTGVDIITSSTAVGGSAGDVLIIAGSATGSANSGTVQVGSITANGLVDAGDVAVGGFAGVTVGAINTLGGTGLDGDVVLGVGTATVTGTPTFTNGVLSGGSFAPGAITAGNLSYGAINAGGAVVELAGARQAGNTISGGSITAGTLIVDMGAGTATVSGNFNNISVDATTAAGGSATITEGGDVVLGDVTGTNVAVTVSAGGDISVDGDAAYGTGTLTLTGVDISETVNGSITGSNLDINSTGEVTLDTTVTNLLASSAVNLLLNNTGALTVNGVVATGSIEINNTGGAVTIAGALDANTGIVVDSGDNLIVNSAVHSDVDVNLFADGDLAINANITADDGALNLIADLGNLTTAANITITGDDFILIQAANGGTINIGATNTIITDAKVTGQGNVSILQGPVPTKTKDLKGKNIIAQTQDPNGFVLTGKGKGTKKVVFNSPDNTLFGQGATVLIKAAAKNGVIINGGATITADPPVAAGSPITITTWSKESTASGDGATASTIPASLASLTAPAAVSSVNMMTTANATATTGRDAISNSLSNLASANNLEIFAGQEDDSTIVGYAPIGEVVDGNVYSDLEFGFAAGKGGNAISAIKHNDLVTLDKGSALFVPSKDTTVVTPKGSVKLAANSVAFISVDGNQLSVYDINDHHKASVVVSTGGRDLTLSPGRHLVVTGNSAKSFGDVNPIESIMHRSVVQHQIGGGKTAFVSEFSIPSAVAVVKPLKAIMSSKEAAARKVADRVLKTSAVVMMVGGQKPFEFHTKPRTVASTFN
jgi:hypothetical protein